MTVRKNYETLFKGLISMLAMSVKVSINSELIARKNPSLINLLELKALLNIMKMHMKTLMHKGQCSWPLTVSSGIRLFCFFFLPEQVKSYFLVLNTVSWVRIFQKFEKIMHGHHLTPGECVVHVF